MPDPLNPHYDEVGVYYDSGFFYADGQPDVENNKQTHNVMAKLKLGLSRRNPENLVALAKHVHPKIAPAAPGVPPVAGVEAEAADLLTACNECEAANEAYANILTEAANLQVVRLQKAEVLRITHTIMGSALETKSKGEVGPLTATGYDLAGPNTQASDPPPKPGPPALTTGDFDGTLDAACDAVPRAHSYLWEVTTVDPLAGPWVARNPTTLSSTTLTGLTSGTRVWVRVAGVGAKGVGPWSDPSPKIVP